MAALHFWNSGLLKPAAIVYEAFQGSGIGKLLTCVGFEMVKREFMMWIGNVRCRPVGSEKHSGGHVVLPEAHRLAENGDAEATILQIGRVGEPIGTCSYNDGVEIHVDSILPCGLQIAQPFSSRSFLKQYLIVKGKWALGLAGGPKCRISISLRRQSCRGRWGGIIMRICSLGGEVGRSTREEKRTKQKLGQRPHP